MCEVDDAYGPDFFSSDWRRARKQHKCCVCRESIRSGDLYHYTAGSWDGRFETFKHCARCWRIFEFLDDQRPGEVALTLDCGEIYEGDPTDPAHFMAFMLPEEGQVYAQRDHDRMTYDRKQYKARNLRDRQRWDRLAARKRA